MNVDELRAILQAGSGQHIELLPENVSSKRLLETMAAFANSAGGIIILGADRRGDPAGLTHPQETRRRAIDLALQTDPPLLIPMPILAELEGKAFLVISVPAGLPHVYGVHGRFLQRVGRRNEPMAGAVLRELILSRSEGDFESEPVENASLDDLDPLRVERYSQLIGAGDMDAARLLVSRGCATSVGNAWRPTVAGLLLFGRDPQRFLPSAEILAVRYPGREMSDEFIKEQIRGPLPEQITRAVAFVERMEPRATRLAGVRREERSAYPPAAVREAIVNAVAHRDYRQRGDTIRLFVFSDRIECYSPGRLPGHVTVENLVQERYSRNEVIVQVLADMGFIERLGYGIDRMIRLMEEWELPAPIFEETTAGFRVTLRGPAGIQMVSPLPHDQGQWVHLDLNPRQEGAIRFLEKHGKITNRDLQQLYPDISDETARRDLADMVAKGLLLKIGDKKATFYILK